LRDFQKRLQKISQDNGSALRRHLQAYDDIMLRVEQAGERRQKQFLEEIRSIQEQYRSIYYANIKQNSDFINNIDNVSNEQWQTFLKDKIFRNNKIQISLDKMYDNNRRDIAEEFDHLQRTCLVMDFATDTTGFRDFQGEAEKLSTHSVTLKKNVERMTTESGGVDVGKGADSAENWLGKFMGGESGIRKRMNTFLTRWTMTPLERTRKMVDAILEDICGGYHIDGILQDYTGFCRELCQESMKGACATQQNAERICTQLKDISLPMNKKGIKQVGLAEILCAGEK